MMLNWHYFDFFTLLRTWYIKVLYFSFLFLLSLYYIWIFLFIYVIFIDKIILYYISRKIVVNCIWIWIDFFIKVYRSETEVISDNINNTNCTTKVTISNKRWNKYFKYYVYILLYLNFINFLFYLCAMLMLSIPISLYKWFTKRKSRKQIYIKLCTYLINSVLLSLPMRNVRTPSVIWLAHGGFTQMIFLRWPAYTAGKIQSPILSSLQKHSRDNYLFIQLIHKIKSIYLFLAMLHLHIMLCNI